MVVKERDDGTAFRSMKFDFVWIQSMLETVNSLRKYTGVNIATDRNQRRERYEKFMGLVKSALAAEHVNPESALDENNPTLEVHCHTISLDFSIFEGGLFGFLKSCDMAYHDFAELTHSTVAGWTYIVFNYREDIWGMMILDHHTTSDIVHKVKILFQNIYDGILSAGSSRLNILKNIYEGKYRQLFDSYFMGAFVEGVANVLRSVVDKTKHSRLEDIEELEAHTPGYNCFRASDNRLFFSTDKIKSSVNKTVAVMSFLSDMNLSVSKRCLISTEPFTLSDISLVEVNILDAIECAHQHFQTNYGSILYDIDMHLNRGMLSLVDLEDRSVKVIDGNIDVIAMGVFLTCAYMSYERFADEVPYIEAIGRDYQFYADKIRESFMQRNYLYWYVKLAKDFFGRNAFQQQLRYIGATRIARIIQWATLEFSDVFE